MRKLALICQGKPYCLAPNFKSPEARRAQQIRHCDHDDFATDLWWVHPCRRRVAQLRTLQFEDGKGREVPSGNHTTDRIALRPPTSASRLGLCGLALASPRGQEVKRGVFCTGLFCTFCPSASSATRYNCNIGDGNSILCIWCWTNKILASSLRFSYSPTVGRWIWKPQTTGLKNLISSTTDAYDSFFTW